MSVPPAVDPLEGEMLSGYSLNGKSYGVRVSNRGLDKDFVSSGRRSEELALNLFSC